jgi:hypothetical protein
MEKLKICNNCQYYYKEACVAEHNKVRYYFTRPKKAPACKDFLPKDELRYCKNCIYIGNYAIKSKEFICYRNLNLNCTVHKRSIACEFFTIKEWKVDNDSKI